MTVNPFDQSQLAVSEVFSSEQSYSQSMTVCYQRILQPLIDMLNNKQIQISNSTEVLKLFEKYHSIIGISNRFINQLNTFISAQDNESMINIFRAFPDIVVRYFDYIELHHQVNPMIMQERSSNPSFEQFLTEKETDAKDTLQSFLILPIQRPPRYRLLIQEIIKGTDEDDPNMPFFNQVHRTICDSIKAVDQKIGEVQEAEQMSELATRLSDFEVFKTGRHLYFEGECTKFSRKKNEIRYIIVFSDILLIAEIGQLTKALKINKTFNSGEYLIIAAEDNEPYKFAIDIKQSEKSFRANLPSAKQKSQILEAFEQVLKRNKLTKHQLEMRGFAPVWIPDNNAEACMICKTKFSFLIRRHHCRYCGNCICGSCFKNKIMCPGFKKGPLPVCSECFEHITKMYQDHPEIA